MKRFLFICFCLIQLVYANISESDFNRYEIGCENGNADNCFFMGTLYTGTAGVETNATQSFKFFNKACSLGSNDGCSMLGLCYYAGQGVSQDYNKAAKYFSATCDKDILKPFGIICFWFCNMAYCTYSV